MQTVSVARTVDASPAVVRDAVRDVGPFMRAAGFDGVTVEGDLIHLSNRVGLFAVQLTVEVVDDPEAVLAYEAREGLFESMRTVYRVDEVADGTHVEAETTFAIGVAVLGEMLDSTVVTRQRRSELEAQFDYLDSL